MKSIGVPQTQSELSDAFAEGLKLKYGPDLAALYRHVIAYRAGEVLSAPDLQRNLELDAAPALNDIVANRVTGSTLRAFRTLIIGSALLGDKAGLIRWTTEASTRCQTVNHDWTTTMPQWEAILKDPEQFIFMARQVKYFLNQL